MEFEWDEAKRVSNLEKHGVDFVKVGRMFRNPTLTKLDDRKDYKEKRFISLGTVDGEIYCVTHTERNDKIRIISAWKGGRKEYEQYKNSFP